jgi:hypothetical protein
MTKVWTIFAVGKPKFFKKGYHHLGKEIATYECNEEAATGLRAFGIEVDSVELAELASDTLGETRIFPGGKHGIGIEAYYVMG